MLTKLAVPILLLATSIALGQNLPDISGSWNGVVCKAQGDMVAGGSSGPIQTGGYIHLEFNPALVYGNDVRYDISVTTYGLDGTIRDHHDLPYNPTHYGHGVQVDNRPLMSFVFSGTSHYKEPDWDSRNVSFSMHGENTSQANGEYSHSNSKGTDIGSVTFSIVHDGKTVQQYIATHPRPCS